MIKNLLTRARLMACAVLLLAAPLAANAQTAADSAGVLLGVATKLQAEGRPGLSRTLLDLIIERYGDTPAGAEARRLRAQNRVAVVEGSGRTELMVFGTTYGLWLGVAIPGAMGADGPEPYGVGLIAGGPIGFLTSRAYARSRQITEGQARAITFGGTWGTWQGFGWAEQLNIGTEEICPDGHECFEGDPSARTLFASAVVGGLTGIGVGVALSQKNITAGTATTVNFGALWGTWFGVALADIAQDDDDYLGAALIGGNVGIVATALAAPGWNLSRGRARLISISGVAGLLTGFGMLLIGQPDDASLVVPMVTSAVGLGLGAHWTRNMDDASGSGAGGSGGSAFLDAPRIHPRIVEKVRNGRLERVPAIGITLIEARF